MCRAGAGRLHRDREHPRFSARLPRYGDRYPQAIPRYLANTMNISATQNIQMAVATVWNHKFRSLLTVLGIVIGITTVVTVASLLTGLRQGVVTFFQSLGPDNIFVSKV